MFKSYAMLLTFFVNSGSSSFSHDLVRNNEVLYKIDPRFELEERDYIQSCIKEIESKSCLVWKELLQEHLPESTWIDLVRAEEPVECSSSRHFFPNTTRVVLSPHCFQEGWVVHQLLHSLGFENEHQRRDRDCYVEVHSDKWSDPAYSIIKTINITFPYDIHSVLHYRRGFFLRPAQDFPDQEVEFGSKDVLTDMDAWKLNHEFCNGPNYCDLESEKCDEINESNRKKGCIQN